VDPSKKKSKWIYSQNIKGVKEDSVGNSTRQ